MKRNINVSRRALQFLALLMASAFLVTGCGDDEPASSAATAGAQGGGGAGVGGAGGQGGVAVDIKEQLAGIEGAMVVEQTSEIDGYRFFLIEFDQPVDHENPAGQRFKQRIALHHRDAAAPTVLASTGYMLWLPSQYLEEPTSMVGGNQLVVEHRYFSPSRPEPADWSKLTIQQAAADHHRVVQAFSPIYSGKWISTGVSKGGMTSVYHHKFYPDDVYGTIAYVAPHSNSLNDPRYIDFLAQDSLATIGANPMFDPAAMQDVGDWLKTKGTHFLFIYGGNDPWAAGAIPAEDS